MSFVGGTPEQVKKRKKELPTAQPSGVAYIGTGRPEREVGGTQDKLAYNMAIVGAPKPTETKKEDTKKKKTTTAAPKSSYRRGRTRTILSPRRDVGFRELYQTSLLGG